MRTNLVFGANWKNPAYLRNITFDNKDLVTRQCQRAMKSTHTTTRFHRPYAGGFLKQLLTPSIQSHPAVLPQWPVDRACAPVPLPLGHQPVPISRKLVHKAVRAGVIGLSYVAYHTRHR